MMSTTLMIIILMMMIRFSSTSRYSADFGRIIYLDFTSPVASALPPVGSFQTILPAVKSDDSPFSRVKLPWAFNFFGNVIYNIFVSPNGAIHQTYDQPCPCACFGDASCPYYGIIAGCLLDLYPPAALIPASITSYTTGSMVSIIFTSVPLFKSNTTVSFRMSLFNDSRIVIDYDKVNITRLGKWITGVRPPENNAHTNLTKVQLNSGIPWNTSTVGIYPPKKVQTGSKYTLCPMSVVWGASPGRVNIATPSDGSYIKLTLIPLLYSCQALIDVVIYFNPIANMKSGSKELVKCINKAGNLPSLLCNISSLPQNVLEQLALPKPTPTLGLIGWRVKDSNAQYSKMPIDGIPLTFYNSITPEIGSCALNSPISTSCGNGICSGNYSCLELPCDLHAPILYKNPTCQNRTISAADPNTCSIDLAYNRKGNKCCTIEQQDCMGTCFGKHSIGFEKAGSTFLRCCGAVDCFNVCDGTATRDACGVCGGQDRRGSTCNSRVKIDTGYGYNRLLTLIDYSQPTKLSSLSKIVITNQNATNIVVNMSVTGSESLSPHILIPSSSMNVTITAFESKTFYINVNVSSLYYGRDANWVVKTVIITYSRPSFSPYPFNYLVDVFPGATNCSSITSVATCMRVPACIFCANYPSLRILRAEEEEGNLSFSEEWTELSEEERYYNSRRRLFTGLVPAQLADLGVPLKGVCTTGFVTSVCVPYSSALNLNISYIAIYIIVFVTFILSY